MRICPNCANMNTTSTDKYCYRDGTALVEAMLCPNCQRELMPYMNFCPGCSKPVPAPESKAA